MWAHLILLLSPDRENHLTLMIVSKQHFHSAITALKNSKFPRDYQDWHLLGFATAYKKDKQSPAELLDVTVPERGSLVSLTV